jgi:hypothetical protein
VPGRREGSDARLGEERGGRVREGSLALVHEARFYPIRRARGAPRALVFHAHKVGSTR